MNNKAHKNNKGTTYPVGLPGGVKGSVGMEVITEEDIADNEGPGSLAVLDALPLVHSTMSM